MQGFEFWYTAVLLVLMTAFLVMELFEADIIIFSALLLLVFGGVIDVNEAFEGFSNEAMLTVGFLFVIAGALKKTGGLNGFSRFLFGKKGSLSRRMFRFITPVSVVSAFFNNTPIVAMLIPVVTDWARKHDVSISKLLIPLSYATILGGVCTLIGTSTNLLVHGLMIDNHIRGFDFFEISRFGVPLAIIGILWISLVGHRMLPDRKDPVVQLGENIREFVVAMKVEQDFQHIGKTIEQAGLRHLKGLFLFQVERYKEMITPAAPDEIIQAGDRLFFTGLPDTIIELQKTAGLTLIKKDDAIDLKDYDSDILGTFEVVISSNSPLNGISVRESNFRSVYDAVIVAVHRSGDRIRSKIGDIVMQAGDTLLILAKHGFVERWYHSKEFFLVSRSADIPSKPRGYFYFSLAILVVMVGVMASGVVPILLVVATAAVLMVVTGCITPHDARSSIDWKVLLIIASAFGISRALVNSGVAHFLAEQLLHHLGSFGILGMLFGIYFITNLYTEIITNSAAAAVVIPIALSLTTQAGIEPRPFMFLIAIAASASFSTPIGYQTNLMVYGPGGYKFPDFLKVGIPMNLIIGIGAVMMVYFHFYL